MVLIGVLIALGTDRADDRFAEPSPLNPQEVHRSRQLAVLQSDPALSSEERRRLIATIAELGTINAAMGLNANQLIDRYHALGEDYRTPPKVLADAKEAIGDIRKGNRAT